MKKKVFTGIAVLLFGFIMINIVQAAGLVPGSDDDPLITSGYLEKKVQELTASMQSLNKALEISLNQKIEQTNSSITVLDKKIENISKQEEQDSSNSFAAVTLPTGKELVCEASTELILRSGKAKAVSKNAAGLSDVTSGGDVRSGALISKDHLLIVPRTDGRGIIAVSSSIVMVRGKYTVQ